MNIGNKRHNLGCRCCVRIEDGKPRVYRMKLTDADGDTFTGIVKAEREPEAWWGEFSAYYTQAVGGFLVPVAGHIAGGNYVRGLPVLEACEPDCLLAVTSLVAMRDFMHRRLDSAPS